MVQRKALIKPEKSFSTSNHFHQETRNKGGDEVKKKKKKMNLQFDDAFKKSLPNYMKPTTCSGARKVIPVNPQTKTSCSGSKPPKILVRNPSLKHVRLGSSVVCNPRKSVKRGTCSSTQKDSKFPKALDLNPGGTSVVKVCPYNYCSLNGHRHEALPPLKSFLESRRLSLKIEQRMKLKKKEKVVNKNQPLVEELGDDFFVEIYAKEVVSCDQSGVVFDDNGSTSDCGSELSICEMDDDGMISLVEYVEFDQVVKDVVEVINELKSCVVSEQRGIQDAADLNSNDAFMTSEIVGVSHEVLDDEKEEENLVGDSSEDGVENLAGESAQLSETDKSTTTTTDSDQECFETSDDETDGDEELRKIGSSRSHTESLDDNPKLRMRFTRKERTEEEEMMMIREFNPRSPNFLPCQPDPDNEKVDLKHQEMDDRKNAEEWMVDYALRQAVTKLSPASKAKVALLVKAFETVVIPMRIQACS